MEVPNRKRKVLTLAVVLSEEGVLLGRKTRGFGAGKWNGFGGKVEAGETIREATVRELEEEAGIRGTEMRKAGVMYFWFDEGEDRVLEIHLFTVTAYTGNPTASEEMAPIMWYPRTAVPYDRMWADDRYWLPALLESPESKTFVAKFRFDSVASENITHHEIVDVAQSVLEEM